VRTSSVVRFWLPMLLVAWLCPAIVWAQKARSLEEKETARAMFREGDELYTMRDYAGALKVFLAADEIMGLPTTGLEVGRTQIQLRQLVEARDTLMRVIRSPIAPSEPDVQAEARAEAEELAAETAGRIPTLRVEVRGVPASLPVVIQLDGKPIASAAIAHGVKVNPGIRIVRAEAAGFITRERKIDVDVNQERIVTLTMRKRPEQATKEVVIDDDVPPQLPPEPWDDAAVFAWSSFGVSAAGLLVGTIFGVLTITKEAALADACQGGRCPESERGNLRQALAFSEVATAGFVVSAVTLGFGITALVLGSDDDDEAARVELTPGGLRFGGRF
jgi:hypothetical protein